MKIEKALKDERMLRAIIGIGVKEFNKILGKFKEELEEYYNELKPDRKRKVGGGRIGALKSPEEKLLFVLFYIKVYPTYDFAAFLYGVARAKPGEWLQRFLPVLEKALGKKQVLPERKVSNFNQLLNTLPEVKEVFLDATERDIQRPMKYKKQKKNYSGKKKRHTKKNTIICDKNKKILFVSKTFKGKTHDKKLYDLDNLKEISSSVKIYGDLGYNGAKNMNLPIKKFPKEELSKEQKEFNKNLSSKRIIVENSIAGIKKFKVLSNKLRNRLYGNFNTVKLNLKDKFILIASGLHNLSLLT